MWTSTPPNSQNPFSSPNSTFSAAILDNEEPPGSNSRLLQRNTEDVWKDISLSSLHHDQYRHPCSRGVVLLDFFSSDSLPAATQAVSPPPSSGRDPDPPITECDHNAVGLGKKRFKEPERNSGDRRHKRMIKNRESAARSRARKQAYTNELELEVAQLLEENARLKKQHQQWYEAAEIHQHTKNKSLYRTSSAPF